jgi:hypothetical protein
MEREKRAGENEEDDAESEPAGETIQSCRRGRVGAWRRGQHGFLLPIAGRWPRLVMDNERLRELRAAVLLSVGRIGFGGGCSGRTKIGVSRDPERV